MSTRRSLGVTLDSFMVRPFYKEALEDGSSVVALDRQGRVLGVRVGNVTRR